ncbi:hypothetical protein FF38_00633 [Lucilia cuprina]|uniref:Uncharacterized protein n=1 Tax=Lucilia cuprina TaxID=7375 RepID=A0A0L0CB38_LUCCU|nr:hypothetical protein FF38_00633 [Lucilia cuprina]
MQHENESCCGCLLGSASAGAGRAGNTGLATSGAACNSGAGAKTLATGATLTATGSRCTTALKPWTGSAVYSTKRLVPSGSIKDFYVTNMLLSEVNAVLHFKGSGAATLATTGAAILVIAGRAKGAYLGNRAGPCARRGPCKPGPTSGPCKPGARRGP